MADSAKNRELVEIVLAVYAGEANDEQIDQLESLLKTDSAARGQFADLMLLQSQIGWSAIYDSEICGEGCPLPIRQDDANRDVAHDGRRVNVPHTGLRSAAHNITRWVAACISKSAMAAGLPLAMAAIALLAIGLSWSQREVQTLRGQLASRESINVPVARLAYASGCDWGNGPLRLHNVGSTIESGDDITLYEGMAEFSLGNGVFASVEAPASMMINSPSSLVLLYGKVTLHVPSSVEDFRTIVGASQFIARDADFGVIHQGNKVDMHVFNGEVRASSPIIGYDSEGNGESSGGAIVTDDTGTFGRAIITAGSAISLVNGDHLVKVAKMGLKATPELFAAKLTMAGALPASKSYSESVLRSQPVGYWRFENSSDGAVPNEIAGGPALKAVGNLRLAGRPNSHAVEFLPGMSYYLISEAPITESEQSNYSIEAWAKPSYVHRGGIVSLISDEPEIHATTIEIQGSPKRPGSGSAGWKHPVSVLFTHHNRSHTKNQDSGTPCFSTERYLVRRWQHIVAVKQGTTMRLYLDGKLVGSKREDSPLSAKSRISVGKDTFTHSLNRDYAGQIDEVAFYDRALTAEEIEGHLQAVMVDDQPSMKPGSGI